MPSKPKTKRIAKYYKVEVYIEQKWHPWNYIGEMKSGPWSKRLAEAWVQLLANDSVMARVVDWP